MLNLYDYLTPLDSKRIYNYITEWGVEDGYVGNDTYLSFWAKDKKKLFHLLGGQLIIKKPFTYEKPKYQIEKEMHSAIRNSKNFFDDILWNRLKKIQKKYDMDDATFDKIYNCFTLDTFVNDKIPNTIKFNAADRKGTLQLQEGMKPVRAIQKIMQYFEITEYKEQFEKFRLEHSMVFNEKMIKGNICISIHPLDFMTMSDNASDWSSCMSWRKSGCYHIGTVEMMNSNNVVCAYIESKTPFDFGDKRNESHKGEEWQWNNKKWRQLFYVTKDIIVGGKSYPYVNEQFTKAVLDILRGLANDNLNWTYSFGPELYKDMKHIGSLYRMDKNKRWVSDKKTFKHNIIFDSKGMYNDMLNAQGFEYWCIRNKVKSTKIISYSGKAPCLCCMEPVIYEDDDYDYYNEGSYNERYKNVQSVICSDCAETRYCDWCGNEENYYTTFRIGSSRFCRSCWKDYIRACPDCGKPFKAGRDRQNNILIRFTDVLPALQDTDAVSLEGNDNFIIACMCSDCREQKIKEGIIEQKEVVADKNRDYYVWHTRANVYLTTKVYDKNDEIVKHYSYNNLVIPEAKDYLD